MADRKVKIDIETTADTSGAKQSTKSLAELDAELKKLQKDLKELPVNSREFSAVTTQAKEAERALEGARVYAKKLGDELARTGNTSEGVSSKFGGNLKGSISQAGFQIQDFAVQVGGGTSAMTAFGQQAPQFLGVFGPAGSIAGAIIAIGAVAFNVFTKMGDDAGTAKAGLDKLDETIEKIAKNKTDELNQEFKDTADAFDLAARRALALKTGIDEIRKAENKLSLAKLDVRAQERETATVKDNANAVAKGKSPDTLRVANDANLRTTEKAQELARQGVDSEALRVRAAQEATEVKAAELKAAEAAQQKAVELLSTERARLTVLREQEAALKKQAKARETDDPGLQLLGAVFPTLIPKTKAADKAQKKLDDPATRNERAVVEANIANLENQTTSQDAELNKKVADLAVELLAAQTNVTNLIRASKINNETIGLELGGTQAGAQEKLSGAADQKQKQAGEFTATQIDQGLSGVEGQLGEVANLPAVRKIIDRVKELAADGIQGGEQNEVATLVGQLVSKIKKPNEDTAKLFQKLLEAINASVDLQTRFAGQIDEVKRRVATIEQGAQGAQRGF